MSKAGTERYSRKDGRQKRKTKKKKTEQRKQLSVISPCRYYPQERHERFNHRLLDIFFHRCESSPEADFSSR